MAERDNAVANPSAESAGRDKSEGGEEQRVVGLPGTSWHARDTLIRILIDADGCTCEASDNRSYRAADDGGAPVGGRSRVRPEERRRDVRRAR